MLYVFLLKPNNGILKKDQVLFLAQFFHKNLSFLTGSRSELNFYPNFYFASSDSLKAVKGCFEKLEISAKRFCLKMYLNRSCFRTRELNLPLHLKYTDLNSIFDQTMVWFDKFFCFEQKKNYLKRSIFALKIYWLD